MHRPQSTRRPTLLLLTCLLGLLLAPVGAARAAGFGELTRFGEPGTGVGKLNAERTRLIGVDPTDNSVFVLEEPKEEKINGKEEFTRFFRLQKFSSKGVLLGASEVFQETSPPSEEEEALAVEGIAVDPKAERVYFLADEPRENGLKRDEEVSVAARLYAFATKPTPEKKLVGASGTTAGVLTTPAVLGSQSEEAGKPLLEPTGITLDPATGEVIVLAHEDHKGEALDELKNPEDHLVLQRIHPDGSLGERYVDGANFLKGGALHSIPDSPVVTPSAPERVYVNFEGIAEIPYEFAKATTEKKPPTQLFAGRHGEEIEAGTAEVEHGGALSVSPEGTLYGLASIDNEQAKTVYSGIYLRSGADGSLIGWTGGQSPVAANGDKCVLEPGFFELPVKVAAGGEGKVFALAPEFLEEGKSFPTKLAIVEFGAGGTGCPEAKAEPIVVSVNGVQLAEGTPIKVGTKAVLSSVVKQADALSVTWEFENVVTKAKETETVTTPQYLKTELARTFEKAGEFAITETIHNDDLATPDIVVKGKLKVEAASTESPSVTENPTDKTVPAGTEASFKAAAKGKPAPAVKWELSTDGGTTFKPDNTDPGNLTNTLTVKATTKSESGTRYRAVFTNKIEGEEKTATSTSALLTVTTQAPTPTTQPQSTTVTAGESATFTAAATGAPAPSIQWQLSTDGGKSWSAIAGANSGSLTLSGTTTGQSGYQYRAQFTNEAGAAQSNAATLTVKPAPVAPLGGGSPGPASGEVLGNTANHAVPAATIAGAALTVSPSGALVIKVSCPAGETSCIGTVTLRTLNAVSASTGGARQAKSKPVVLTLASGSFAVAGGARKAVALHLSSKARRLLARVHVLRARATVAAHDPAGARNTALAIVTLRAAKKKH